MLFALTIVLSSALLFLIQPMVAKAMLPGFGGAAAVWTTCFLFFQVVLLAGYFYAYSLSRWLSVRAGCAVHVSLLVASVVVLCLAPAADWKPRHAEGPVVQILGRLLAHAGLPYFLLATTGPLIQRWYSNVRADRIPYRLFAVSNAASLAGLIAYPFVVEPFVALRHQFTAWAVAYGIFAIACITAAVYVYRAGKPTEPATSIRLTGDTGTWVALAACSSALWLSCAAHISQDIAAVPLLWILLLSLYLLSFVMCFSPRTPYSRRVYVWMLPAVWAGMMFAIARGPVLSLRLTLPLLAGGLFTCCLFCHGELWQRKPDAHGLTGFYLAVAGGGAVGAVLVSVVAPLAFSHMIDLPMALAACVMLALKLLYGYSARRLARLGIIVTLAFVVVLRFQNHRFAARNFYGALRVSDLGEAESAVRILYHGSIEHGAQFLSPSRTRTPTVYFGPSSGAGQAITAVPGNRRVGAVGLGAGVLASYGRPGDYFRFYEINPMVVQVANTEFSFLRESGAKVDVRLGDARLSLESEPDQQFDVLILDAFSGDSIPAHLLTREAFGTWMRHLKPGATLAVHVSNKFLDLAPLVESLAEREGKPAIVVRNASQPETRIQNSTWVLIRNQAGTTVASRRITPWTDDYSNLLSIIR